MNKTSVVTLCELTARHAIDGACPEHGGDSCLIVLPAYVEQARERISRTEHRAQDAESALAQALKERDWTHQWYAERIEEIRDEAKRVGNWDRVASILANGTPSVLDPPTYAQQLNIAKHRAESAEQREQKLRAALEEIEIGARHSPSVEVKLIHHRIRRALDSVETSAGR